MKKCFSFLILIFSMLIFAACNTDPGTGGTATLEGVVMMVQHPDDHFNLETDTVPAAKTDVFLVYGDNTFYDDDVEADNTGLYRFKYLRPGTYTVYAYTTRPSGERVAETQTVNVERGQVTTVPTIYVHEGKAYGRSIVKGTVNATYIDKNGDVTATGPAYGHRMYIQRVGEPFPFDDVRVGINGVFMFQKIDPGDYIVFTTSIYDEDEIPYLIQRNVTVTSPETIVEIEEPFQVTIKP